MFPTPAVYDTVDFNRQVKLSPGLPTLAHKQHEEKEALAIEGPCAT